MSEWKSYGDINPEYGTWLMRNARLEGDEFHADVIQIIPETDVGGSDRVFDISAGLLFLARKDWPAALRTVGAKIEGDHLIRDDGKTRIDVKNEDFLIELFFAARAHFGAEVEYSTIVGRGVPMPYDQEGKFEGEVVLFPDGTSLWSIVKSVTDGFDYVVDGQAVEAAKAHDMEEGPYAGMPRNIRKMADLGKIKSFAEHGVDEQGNPKVWKHAFTIPDDNQDPEIVYSAHEIETYLFEGEELTPSNTTWVGPEQEDLCELWESLYQDNRAPKMETSVPEF